MSALTALPFYVEGRLNALRKQLEKARVVFDFAVLSLPEGAPDEAAHRQALRHFFAQKQQAINDYFAQLAVREPKYANLRPQPLRVAIEDAQAQTLNADCVFQEDKKLYAKEGLDLRELNWFEQLEYAFYHPPYETAGSDAEKRALFVEFCKAVGLFSEIGLTILDWVGDHTKESQLSNWSDYFDDGKEWWGIWCMSIWNPKNKTLAVIAASATD